MAKEKSKEWKTAQAQYIAESNLSFLHCDSQAYKSFVLYSSNGNMHPYSSTTIKEEMLNQATIIRSRICDELQNVPFLAVTVDSWSSLCMDNYTELTVHTIRDDWTTIHYPISCEPHEGKGARALCNCVEERLQSYNCLSKLVIF